MNRRDFLTCFGVGWVASCLPIALAACSPQESDRGTNQPSAGGSNDWQKVGTSGELDKTGQLLVKKSPAGPVSVVGKSGAASLIAVNPTCSHAGCDVGWQESGKKFTCPCHGSEFGSDGKVLKGPATKPLETYNAKVEGGSVLVKSAG